MKTVLCFLSFWLDLASRSVIISAAPAPAAARLDQDVFKKIFSFWEPLGHEMWLDLARDSVHLDRFCRASTICKRMLIPHVEYD